MNRKLWIMVMDQDIGLDENSIQPCSHEVDVCVIKNLQKCNAVIWRKIRYVA